LLLDVGAVVRKGGVLPRFGRHAGLVVRGDLAGGVERFAGENALAVMRHRRGRALARDDFLRRLATPEIDFDPAPWHEEPADLHRGARRRGGEELLPHLVEMVEVV